MRMCRVAMVVALWTGVVGSVGCDDDDDDDEELGIVPPNTGGLPGASVPADEAQALAIALEINNGEIMVNQVGDARAVDDDVRSFARELIIDHQESNTQLLDEADERGIIPTDHPLRQQLATMAAQTAQSLWAEPAGPNVDARFVQSQVEMHATALGILDQQVLPVLQNSELLDEVEDLRDAVAEHLSDAQELIADEAITVTEPDPRSAPAP